MFERDWFGRALAKEPEKLRFYRRNFMKVSRSGGENMSPFEIISIVLVILEIITQLIIALVNANEKSNHEK